MRHKSGIGDRQLFKFPSAFSVPTSTHPAHSTSQILSSSRRDMDLITLVLKCPQAFSEIFHFFQQQYVQFFPLFSLLHLEICQQQNIVPTESHAREPEKKCTYLISWITQNFPTCSFSSKGGKVKSISFLLESPHPKPPKLAGWRKVARTEIILTAMTAGLAVPPVCVTHGAKGLTSCILGSSPQAVVVCDPISSVRTVRCLSVRWGPRIPQGHSGRATIGPVIHGNLKQELEPR